jgi:hypothetical protein
MIFTRRRARARRPKGTRRIYKKINYPRCQCIAECNRQSIPGKPFCEYHMQNGCPRKPALTGYEPPYDPNFFNKNPDLKGSHNCAAYAFGYLNMNAKKDDAYPQPGAYSGYPRFSKIRRKTCPDMLARVFGDMPSVKPAKFEERCPAHMSKIALAVDSRSDYHVWRQGPDGMWSHKPGATDVTDKDAFGRPIYDPEIASRNYNKKGSHLNYNRFCGYLCVRRDKQPRMKQP